MVLLPKNLEQFCNVSSCSLMVLIWGYAIEVPTDALLIGGLLGGMLIGHELGYVETHRNSALDDDPF